jgi:hypothetical protein
MEGPADHGDLQGPSAQGQEARHGVRDQPQDSLQRLP